MIQLKNLSLIYLKKDGARLEMEKADGSVFTISNIVNDRELYAGNTIRANLVSGTESSNGVTFFAQWDVTILRVVVPGAFVPYLHIEWEGIDIITSDEANSRYPLKSAITGFIDRNTTESGVYANLHKLSLHTTATINIVNPSELQVVWGLPFTLSAWMYINTHGRYRIRAITFTWGNSEVWRFTVNDTITWNQVTNLYPHFSNWSISFYNTWALEAVIAQREILSRWIYQYHIFTRSWYVNVWERVGLHRNVFYNNKKDWVTTLSKATQSTVFNLWNHTLIAGIEYSFKVSTTAQVSDIRNNIKIRIRQGTSTEIITDDVHFFRANRNSNRAFEIFYTPTATASHPYTLEAIIEWVGTGAWNLSHTYIEIDEVNFNKN